MLESCEWDLARRSLQAVDRLALDPLEKAIDSTKGKVREKLIRAMATIRDKLVIGILVNLLEDKEKGVPELVAPLLANLTGKTDFGPDAAKWKKWWARSKHRFEFK